MKSIKEFLEYIFWKIIMPYFRIKWWFKNRKERKKFRECEKWNYILHGYETCIFYRQDSEYSEEYCDRKVKQRWRIFKKYSSFKCDKSKKCKHYMHDRLKSR